MFNKSIQTILWDLSKKGMIVVDSGGKTPKATRTTTTTTTKKTKTKTTKRAHARSWLSHHKYNDSIIFMLISATLKVHFSRFVTNTSKPRLAPVFSACKVSMLKITQHASLSAPTCLTSFVFYFLRLSQDIKMQYYEWLGSF